MLPYATLDALPCGAACVVRDAGDALRELGLLPGTRVECILESPLGDPRAYRIRGCVLALRRQDAASVRLCDVPAPPITEAPQDAASVRVYGVPASPITEAPQDAARVCGVPAPPEGGRDAP